MEGLYIGTHQRSFERYYPRPPIRPPLSQDWGFATPIQNSNRYYLRKGYKATEFKFGQYIHRAYPNKSTLKIVEKRVRGRIQGLSN